MTLTSRCPRCHHALDEGPILYRCAHCQRTIWAADLDVEHHAPAPMSAA
ncbi:hypothetical protein [Nonomuraea rhodomycinica]|uniref:Uncharacterized protein n=1 Tax=Nonomuraea rhodomycinica TaxID=1712872 RepID=A0A7Y6IWA8_9ACTN|nr:hypothetical protein [Nonomuraea rhodomycinica]NUW45520.1 hypothetical protein [Nonomuraea rhodomycinica]